MKKPFKMNTCATTGEVIELLIKRFIKEFNNADPEMLFTQKLAAKVLNKKNNTKWEAKWFRMVNKSIN